MGASRYGHEASESVSFVDFVNNSKIEEIIYTYIYIELIKCDWEGRNLNFFLLNLYL